MIIKEVSASLYPWDLADEGADQVVDNLVRRCNVNSLYLIGIMHYEKRPLTSLFFTHNPNRKYYLPEDSHVYYRLDMKSFDNTPMKPSFAEDDFLKGIDWLDVLIKEARSHGMRAGIELSHTVYDTAKAIQERPDTMQRDVNGNIIGGFLGMLCSNHPDVREYQRALFAETVRSHDIDFIQTCLITFADGKAVNIPWFFKEWLPEGNPYLGPLLGLGKAGCFCPHCKALALKLGYDWDLILKDMKILYYICEADHIHGIDHLLEQHMALGSNASQALLLMEYPGLMEFLKFRVDSVALLIDEISGTVHKIRPGIDFRYNNFTGIPEFSGISYKRLARYLDSVRDCEYSEQFGGKDDYVTKRKSLLGIRRGIGMDKRLLAGIGIRPNAKPEDIYRSLELLSTVGIDGISLGHYDCAHLTHLDAVGEGMKRVQMKVVDEKLVSGLHR
jgi:hypothetical protein